MTDPIEKSHCLSPPKICKVQETVGVLLYYTRAVNSTLLIALNTIGSQQPKATKNTQDAVNHLIHYCSIHPDATIQYIPVI